MKDKTVKITDTILRDAHQCLIATRLRTEDMLPICPKLDAIGYWSLEMWGGATFDACVRFLKEDPWQRLRALRKALPNTPLQMLLRGQNLLGYRNYADDIIRVFIEKSAHNGIDVFRVFDALNDMRNLRVSIEAIKKIKKHAQGAIAYTVSPVHNLQLYLNIALEMQEMGCDSIAIKDMAGLLTPYDTESLVKTLVSKLNIPIHIHSHASSGLSAMCQLKAIENGCYHIDTAISSFAEGASHPGTESMVAALKNTPYDTKLELSKLEEIAAYFREVRKKYHRFESESTRIDTRVQMNQIPGGMISNLDSQLKQHNALDQLEAVQQEIQFVRKDLGYPPLVTPTSQIVGTQAVLNVLQKERYKIISNEVKWYFQGRYGAAPGPVNETLKKTIIGEEKVLNIRPADLLSNEMPKLKKEIGDLAKSLEDVLIYAMFPDIGKVFLEQREKNELIPEPLELPELQNSGITSTINTNSQAAILPSKSFNITFHGKTHEICIHSSGDKNKNIRPFYFSVNGVSEEVIVESTLSNLTNSSAAEHNLSKQSLPISPGQVTAIMPSRVIEVFVKNSDIVKIGDRLLVLESMKMEIDVKSPINGFVEEIHVKNGDNVRPNEILITIK